MRTGKVVFPRNVLEIKVQFADGGRAPWNWTSDTLALEMSSIGD